MAHPLPRRMHATVAAVVAILLVAAAGLALGAGAATKARPHELASSAHAAVSAVAGEVMASPDPLDRPVATTTTQPRTVVAGRALGPLLLFLVAGLLGWLTTTRRRRRIHVRDGATPRSWIACSVAPRAPPVSSHP